MSHVDDISFFVLALMAGLLVAIHETLLESELVSHLVVINIIIIWFKF